MKQIQLIRNNILLGFLIVRHFFSRYKERLFAVDSSHDARYKSSKSGVIITLFKRNKKMIAVICFIGVFVWGANWVIWYRNNQIISVGIVGFYNKGTLPPFVASLVTQSLVTLDEHGIPKPNLAADWQVSSDSAKYQLNLKKQLVWSDGTPVKSSDIKLNLPDVQVSYPSNSSIQFSLADSFSPFFSLLTTPIFKESSYIGLGKYKISRIETNRELITKLILKAHSPAPDISVRFYPDEKTAKTAFSLGEIDGVIGISEPNEFKEFPLVEFENLPDYNHLVTIFYNVKDPVLSDKNMRRGLNCALPLIAGEEKAKTSIPVDSWAYNDSVNECVDNQQAAKDYFDKVQSGKDKTVILTTTPALSTIAQKIVQSWKKNGISAQVRVENGVSQNFQALLISQSIPSDPDQYILWHSTQSKTNLSQYSFARIDKDLEDGRKISNLDTRKEKYADMQKTLAEDVPASFLYFPKTTIVSRLRIKNELNKVLQSM